MPSLPGPFRILKYVFVGIWRTVEFVGALIYYLLTEIFVDPFIIIKPIKIAAQWLYGNCDRIPVLSLYFIYLVNPQGKRPIIVRASQTPWVVAMPPVMVVALTVVVKVLAISLVVRAPLLAAAIYVGDKIVLIPVALRMWDEVRPVVRRDFVLRQVDEVVYFLFHILPFRARDIVRERVAQMKRIFAPYLAPIRERMRAVLRPLRDALRPAAAWIRQRLRSLAITVRDTLKAWAMAARDKLRSFFSPT